MSAPPPGSVKSESSFGKSGLAKKTLLSDETGHDEYLGAAATVIVIPFQNGSVLEAGNMRERCVAISTVRMKTAHLLTL